MIPMMMAAETRAAATEGELWSSGENGDGQLGHGGTTDVSSPVQVGSDTNWVQVSCTYRATIGRKSDGTIWTWGSGRFGVLGHNNTTYLSAPTQVGSATDWTDVSMGGNYVVGGIKSGKLYMWGYGAHGGLGTGTTINRSVPTQVGSATTWTKLAAGRFGGTALTGGKIYCWGRNDYGQLGDGSTTSRSAPVQVGSATNWVRMDRGHMFVMAINTDGKLYGWGNGSLGGRGTGSATHHSTPVQIGSDTDWDSGTTQGALAGYGMLIAKATGKLYVSGKGNDGRLGTGSVTDISSPVQVGVATNWTKPLYMQHADPISGCINSLGELFTWGRNTRGQLGHGTTTSVSVPVQVGSLQTWLQGAMSGGGSRGHLVAIKTP